MTRWLCKAVLATAMMASTAMAAVEPFPDQTVAMRVAVDSQGRVTSVQPLPGSAADFLVESATKMAPGLVFQPARRDGQPVGSATTLYLTFEFQPLADGRIGLHLKQASNGPTVTKLTRIVVPPRLKQSRNSADVVVSVVIHSDGSTDMDSFRVESVKLRVPSEFEGTRSVEAIKVALKTSEFSVDQVDGKAISERVDLSFRFGAGPGAEPEHGDRRSRLDNAPVEPAPRPEWKARSEVPGIDLPKVLFSPAAAPEKQG